MLIRQANTLLDLTQILTLQKKNTQSALSAKEIEEQGFVTVEHRLVQLKKMQALVPQIIAVKKNLLLGYALVMPKELKTTIPVLVPMFKLLDTLNYKGQAVQKLSYYVMGQICVAKSARGQGVFRALYKAHKNLLAEKYDYCITEISSRNLRSMQAHLAIGFDPLHTFTDEQDEWNIMIWDWTK